MPDMSASLDTANYGVLNIIIVISTIIVPAWIDVEVILLCAKSLDLTLHYAISILIRAFNYWSYVKIYTNIQNRISFR